MKKLYATLLMLGILLAARPGICALTWTHQADKDIYYVANGTDVVRVVVRVKSDRSSVHPSQAVKAFVFKQDDICDSNGNVVDSKILALVKNDPAFAAIIKADK